MREMGTAFTQDSRRWGGGTVSTCKLTVGCIPPCYTRDRLAPLAFIFVCKPAWEKVAGQEQNLTLQGLYLP